MVQHGGQRGAGVCVSSASPGRTLGMVLSSKRSKMSLRTEAADRPSRGTYPDFLRQEHGVGVRRAGVCAAGPRDPASSHGPPPARAGTARERQHLLSTHPRRSCFSLKLFTGVLCPLERQRGLVQH